MGIRASGARKIPCKYHGMGAKTGADITVEGDEGYTHVGENLPPVNRMNHSSKVKVAIGLRQGQE